MALEVSLRTSGAGPRLEWDGKRTQVERIQLPFQVIETVNEPRTKDMFSAQAAEQALATGWRNKLIWGDNKLVCASLLKEYEGKIDLIYIDPPFDTGQDFSFRLFLGDEQLTKLPSVIETKAYNDMWASLGSYLQMMYDRLVLMKQVLASNGTIYLHVGGDVANYVRIVLDEVFGLDGFINEIVWKRADAHNDVGQGARFMGRIHDLIFVYSNGNDYTWNTLFHPLPTSTVEKWYRNIEAGTGRRFNKADLTARKPGGDTRYQWKGALPPPGRSWAYSKANMEKMDAEGRLIYSASGMPYMKRYLDESKGVPLQDFWDDISMVRGISSAETLGYPTQKPEALLDRIIRTSSNEGDLVADFFCGSGTTLAVAEKLGRRWVGADLGHFAVHTTRKRLLDIAGCKPFEVLNLGKYERQYWQGVTTGRDDSAYMRLILQLYRAEPLEEGTLIHGLKAGIAVHVGPIDSVVTIEEAIAAAEGARELGYKRLHILGWDWQMGLKETAVDDALALGVQLALKRIPSEIMDSRAREKGDVEFFEMNHVDATAEVRGRSVQVFLDDFIIADLELVKPEIQERIEKFSDYIDYWAVDFDYGDDTFHNQWQSFRTRKQPKLELESAVHSYADAGAREVLVKVIDIFGNDTTKLLKVSIQ